MANRILEDITINEPVSDLTALAAIPTGSLTAGCVCQVQSVDSFYRWNGSAWLPAPVAITAMNTEATTTSLEFLVSGGTDTNNKSTLAAITGDQTLTGNHTVTGESAPGTLAVGTSATVGTTLDVTGNISAANFPGSGGGGNTLFDADVGPGATYTTLKAAIDAGKKSIEVIGSTTETADITIADHTYVYFQGNFTVAMGTNRINLNAKILSLDSAFYILSGGMSFALTSANPCIYGTTSGLICKGITITNASTVSNCPLVQTSDAVLCDLSNFTYIHPDLADCGIETGTNSLIHNAIFNCSLATSFTNVLMLGNDSVADIVSFIYASFPANTIITIGTRSTLRDAIYSNGASSFNIDNFGQYDSSNSNGNNIDVYAKVQNSLITNCDLGTGSVFANQFTGGYVSNCVFGVADLSNSSDTNWKIENSNISSDVNIGADNCKIIGNEILGNLDITNANSCLVVGNQVDSDAGGGSNVITITGTSNHCLVTNNKVNTLPADSTGNDNLIDNNSIHGSTPPPTGGDVVGPASSVDNNLVSFDGVTGKLIKDLGLPVTSTLTDVSSIAPTNGQIFAYSTTTSEWVPTNPASGSTSAFYDAIVAPAGGDYSTVAGAVAAGHEYILVDATLAIPVIELGNVVLTKSVYIYIKGTWNLGNFQIDFNSVGNIELNIDGTDTINSVLEVAYTTALQPLFANVDTNKIKFSNFHYNNTLAGLDLGKISVDNGAIFENFKLTAPNSINNGIDLSGAVSTSMSYFNNIHLVGGGIACGAILIPGDNNFFDGVKIEGNFFEAPINLDAVDNKQAIIWTDPLSPKIYHIENLYFNPIVVNVYSFMVTGKYSNWDSSASMAMLVAASDCEFNYMDLGSASPLGSIYVVVHSDNVLVNHVRNIRFSDSSSIGTTVENWRFTDCDFATIHSTFSDKSFYTNCSFPATLNSFSSKCRISDCNMVEGVTIFSGSDECSFTGCYAGVDGLASTTFTINSGANNTTILGCYSTLAIIDNGTSTEKAYNHVV